MNLEPSIPSLPGLTFQRKLGSGGFADVYLYERELPRRLVALKVLRSGALSEAEVRRFFDEANVMAELAGHPHIVPVLGAGTTEDGRPYLEMQYYPGPDLAQQVRQRPLSVSAAIRTGIQLASAIETAHRAGITHRDIKPHNVLTSAYGDPALNDFGNAGRFGEEGDWVDIGVSVPWAAPEVLKSESDGTAAADVYSLGATVWHALAGRSPFFVPGGDNSSSAMFQRVLQSPPAATGRDDVPDIFERLLGMAMSKDPGHRPSSALEFARVLQSVEAELHLDRTTIVVLEDDPSDSRQPTDRGRDAGRRITPSAVVPDEAGDPGYDHLVGLTINREALLEALRPTVPPPPPGDVAPPAGAWEPPDAVGNYRILGTVAHGAHSYVLRATHADLGHTVALKQFELAGDQDDSLVRYRRQGQLAFSLEHPGLVRVRDMFTAEAHGYVAFEWINGLALHQAAEAERWDFANDRVERWVRDLCSALTYIHGQDLLHLAIKPDNVMVRDDGSLVIIDFQSLYPRRAGEGTYEPEFVTAAFAPPEVLDEAQTPQVVWDVYSLAATLYWLISSRLPLPGGTASEAVTARTNEIVDLADVLRSTDVRPSIVEAIMAGLSRDPAARPQSPAEFLERCIPGCTASSKGPMPRGTKTLISYRRGASSHLAGRLGDVLESRFGRDEVFIDVDAMPVGVDFVDHLKAHLAECAAVVVVIGTDFTASLRRRLRWSPFSSREDYMLVEIETALALGIPILPVLEEGTEMPRSTTLPDSIQNIATLNAVTLGHGRTFRSGATLVGDKIADLVALYGATARLAGSADRL